MSADRDLLRLLVEAYNGDSVEIMEHRIADAIALLSTSESFKPDWDNYRQGAADTKLELRDHFASLTMPMYACTGSPESRARNCYAEADAMLEERSKSNV